MGISVVRSSIARFVKLFVGQHTPVSVTGNTAETTLFSAVIPGGTLDVNGLLRILSLFSISSAATFKSIRIKLGGVVIWQHMQISTNAQNVQIDLALRNRNSLNSQVSFANVYAAYVTLNSLAQATTIDTSVDQTLVITGQLVTPTATKSVSGITRSGQTATATSTAHGYANGNSVLMSGANQTEYNGTFVISNVTTNTFDYTVTGTPATPATGTILAALWDIITLETADVEVKTGW